jgi:4-amino-4-deoxy-L-arabinose transferase-like glycosyltransferase
VSERDSTRGKSGTAIVVWIAVGTVLVHLATGWRYGFDRDELMALEDARHLAWGYVQYPPMTAFLGRLALELFGTSLVGFRFLAALVQAVALVLTGRMAKELGGGKWAQVVAALAGVPFCLGAGALMQYISFDYVCWVVVSYCMVRLLKSGDARWWLGVGAGIGLGMLAKYTMGFLGLGVAAGVLLTGARKYLRSGWLWGGMLVAVGIFLPNLLWEWQRHFVSLEFLRFIHERDVQEGLTNWFLPGQVELTLLAFPLALAGLYFCFFAEEGKRFRALGWMYVVPLALFVAMRGRDYYLAPAYPMLYAAGAVWVEGRVESGRGKRENGPARAVRPLIWTCLILDVVIAAAVALPIAPVNSRWWNFAAQVDTVFPEEIGWPEFVETVAQVRDRLPAEERGRAGILAGNYGELGAVNLYGEKHGLPRAISGVNSSWERGYGDPAPETLIVVGYSREFLEKHFASCEVAGHPWNRYGVANEETMEDPDIFVCRGLKESWGEFWKAARRFA